MHPAPKLIVAAWLSWSAGASADRPIEWSPEVLISAESNTTVMTSMLGGAIAVTGSAVHVVWVSCVSRTNNDVYYRRSDDGGATWGEVLRLTRAEVEASKPTVLASSQNVYVVWGDKRYNPDGSIFFKYSKDNGRTWSQDTLLSPKDVRSAAPSLAAEGDEVFVAWEHYYPKTARVRVRRSGDGGVHWDDPVDVTGEGEESGCPSITPGAGYKLDLVHCSLKDAGASRNYNWELYYKRSLEGVTTWSASRRLTIDPPDKVGDSRFPLSAVSGNTLHVVWYDDRDDTKYPHSGYPPITPEEDHNFEVYYKRSPDHGATWENDVRLTNAPGVAASTSIAARGDRVFAVWEDNRDGNEEIYCKYSLSNGSQWSEDLRLTNNAAPSRYPSLATDAAGNVYVVYLSGPPAKREIYFRKGVLGALPAPVIGAVANAAASQSGPVAPGEFVSIYGAGLGSAQSLIGPEMRKGLGGVKVTFSGIEAYLTFVSSGQVNALVPYAVSGSASVVLEYAGSNSSAFSLQVAPAAPGIFTTQYGAGQAVVINQDLTFNSDRNAAARRTYVTFFVTGQGQVSPAGKDGDVIVPPNFPAPVLPVKVSFGGVETDPAFAGLIFTGVMQVNVRIPDNAPVGSAVPLTVRLGNTTSRQGVTIAVK